VGQGVSAQPLGAASGLAISRRHRPWVVVAVSNRPFGWRGVKGQQPAQNSGGSSAVLGAAEDAQRPSFGPSGGYLHDVVGDQVGRGVGGVVAESGAPVAHAGAVVGDQAAAFGLGMGAHVGAVCGLHAVQPALAVSAPGLAAYLPATVEAGAEQALAHRRLRRRRWRSLSRQG